jgi:hypothetical protein
MQDDRVDDLKDLASRAEEAPRVDTMDAEVRSHYTMHPAPERDRETESAPGDGTDRS